MTMLACATRSWNSEVEVDLPEDCKARGKLDGLACSTEHLLFGPGGRDCSRTAVSPPVFMFSYPQDKFSNEILLLHDLGSFI